jgi:hypothetical protein
VIDTSPFSITVGVVPEPALAWPGFSIPLFAYTTRQTTFGSPPGPASKR